MNYYKIYLKTYLKAFLAMLVYSLLLSTFHYFNVFNITTTKIILFIFTSFLFIYLGINISRYKRSKGYLNGIIVGTLAILLFLLLSLVFKEQINLKTILYYTILMFSSLLGGIIGINIPPAEVTGK